VCVLTTVRNNLKIVVHPFPTTFVF